MRNRIGCIALAAGLIAGCFGDSRVRSTEPPADVVGRLIEVALEAHEDATGTTRPKQILLNPRGLDREEVPVEIAAGIRRRIDAADGQRSAGQDGGDGHYGWILGFYVDPDQPQIVYVEVREMGATGWPMYGVSVTRTASGLEVGQVVGVGRVET